MAINQKLRERAEPYLEPGEQMQTAVLAQTTLPPWLGVLLGSHVGLFAFRFRPVPLLAAGMATLLYVLVAKA